MAMKTSLPCSIGLDNNCCDGFEKNCCLKHMPMINENIFEELANATEDLLSYDCSPLIQQREVESIYHYKRKSRMKCLSSCTESWQITESEDNLNPGDRSEPNEVCITIYCKLYSGVIQPSQLAILQELIAEIRLINQETKKETHITKFSFIETVRTSITEAFSKNSSFLQRRSECFNEIWDKMSTTKVPSYGSKNVTSHTYSVETSGKNDSSKQNDSTPCQRRNSFFIQLLILFCGNLTIATGYQVELVPHRAVYFAKSNALYTCNVDNAIGVQWYFNGTLQDSNNTVFSSLIGVGVLRINNISLKFNSTSIECEGVYNDGMARSVAGFMLVQGILDVVTNLNYSLINMTAVDIFWSAPFSLDVSDSNIDIMYCVDIFNSSSSHLMHSNCDISATHYSWEYIPELIACGWYEIHVTAFNVVGNSTVSNITAWAGEYKEFKVKRLFMDKKSEYEIVLLNQDFCPENTELFISNQMISYTSKSSKAISLYFENYRHYGNLSLQVTSPNGVTIRSSILSNLKTYDVNSSSIFTSSNNTIKLQSSFILNSSADGVLYALLYYNDGTYNFLKSLFYPVVKDIAQEGITLPANAGMYNVLAYDIDSNGIIQSSGLPSTSEIADIEGSLEMDVHDNQQCSLNLVDYQVEVNCNCHHTYFQLAILARDTSIISKRSSCSQTVRVILNPDESFEYSAIVFIEDENDSIFTSRDSIIVMEFSVQQPTSTIVYDNYDSTTTPQPTVWLILLSFALNSLLGLDIVCIILIRSVSNCN